MKAIVCIDLNYNIGYNGKLLFNVKQDMNRFKNLTTAGGIILMGRKTFENDLKGKPLKDRLNIVLTSNMDIKSEPGLMIVHSKYEALELIDELGSDKVFIIGGEKIYKEFLPYCDTLYLTSIQLKGSINGTKYKSDVKFPMFFNNRKYGDWTLTNSSDKFPLSYVDNSLIGEDILIETEYQFKKYTNIEVKSF